MPSATDHIASVWGRIFNIMVDHGEGTYLYDTNGRRYIDFTCGIGVTNTGHAHPQVVKAIQAQAAKMIHAQANIMYHQPMLELVDELLTIMPAPVLDSFFFSNSGAEILEAAVKLAKQVNKRPSVIVFSGSFHGRTHLTMSMTTSKTIYRLGYQPLVPGIFVTPFPYAYQLGMDEANATDYCIHELKRLLKSQVAPEEVACIVIEPVLGEGGYVVPPVAFMQELRKICDQYGIWLVADEVQSGFGRTGKYFAVEHFSVVPDILVSAKGIASGLPLSMLATRKELMNKWTPGSHGGTFGGNVIACAAAVATIRAIKQDQMLDNTVARGDQLVMGLKKLQKDFSSIGDVRGKGLMIATEFTKNGEPDTDTTKAVVKAAFDRGLMLLTCGTYDNVIRWIPPLVVTKEQIDEALTIFAAVLDTVTK
ncbi:MAG TPA: aminotransferase class III-fold pyridoxal phosphate-dependent enzyme [Anaerolineae bacterium]|nr:aminotransferase class III-fold pyridoxal phosphate-dependent enzyme [Anaerolineae bacterium]